MNGTITAGVYDSRACHLGEGPLWHPQRQQLFWFDILNNRLLSKTDVGPQAWQFDLHVSAAGWLDRDHLLIAGESALLRYNLMSQVQEEIVPLEADNPVTRSNDGRADPWGGFWIGTMGKRAEADAGAIYRYYRGELRRLYAPLTIPNAICFSPDRRYAYFADTARQTIWRQPLRSRDGWPQGDPERFIDCTLQGVHPDGAVVDSAGRLWNAQWGASRVACYGPDGRFLDACPLPAAQVTCPAFGGPDYRALYVTSATEGLSPVALAQQPAAGHTFVAEVAAEGQPEPRVILG